MGKYDGLIYEMPVEYHNWEHYVSPRCGYRGTRADPGATVNYGFSVTYDENVMEEAHMHDAKEEYLFFTGADLTDFYGSFDAEVEVWLGKDPRHMEKITLTKPSIIRVPPKVWHCPINFRRVGKPVCFIPFYMDGSWCKILRKITTDGKEDYTVDGEGLRHCVYEPEKVCTYCGKCFAESERTEALTTEQFLAPFRTMEKEPRTGEFDRLVFTFEQGKRSGEGQISSVAVFDGIRSLAGSGLSVRYELVNSAVDIDGPHFHNAVTEYLMFTGADLMNPFESFDAEITIMLGEDADHMEEYTITKPSVIRIPPNLWHGPVRFRRVGKPVNFLPFYPDGVYGHISRREIGGEPLLVFENARPSVK